jgi:hypothetical protein
MDEFVVVGAYGSELEADLVVQRLAGAGIHATTRSDNVGGTFPSMDLATGGVEVLVPEHRLAEAHRALSQTPPAPSSRQRHRELPQATDRGRAVRRVVTAAVFVLLILIVLAAMPNFLDNPLP